MDFNPLIPNATNSHDVAHILSESFEDTIKGYIFPSNVADNIRKNNLDQDYVLFKKYGLEVKEVAEVTLVEHANLRTLEAKMMEKQARNMILEKSIEDDLRLKEDILLKRDGLFQSYPFNVEKHNLIDKKDVLPTVVEKSLDFVHKKELHYCKFEHSKKSIKCIEKNPRIMRRIELENCNILALQRQHEDVVEPLKLDPPKILFDNFEINTLYKRKICLQNCSSRKRPFFYKYPRNSPFSLKLLSNTHYLAPGMHADFLVTYYTKIYHNYSIDIEFSTSGGQKTILGITSFRKPPHLRVYIFRSMENILSTKCPGTLAFWERRCTALNDTIDCGHCFLGNYNYLSLIIGNVGSRGHFFCLSEDEWISGDVSNIDHTMQFAKDCFKIFPTYISIEQDEVAEICVTFTPNSSGLHIEKLYLISDNNTAKAVEILGDGLYFSKNMFQVFLKPKLFENLKNVFTDCKEDEELSNRHCIFMGQIENLSENHLTLSVNNKSALYLNFYWILRKNENDSSVHNLNPNCIQVKNIDNNYFSPYTTYDFDVEISPEVDEPGYYNIFLSLFIEHVPDLSLLEGEEFIIRNPVEIENSKYVDVQICELEIACDVFIKKDEKKETDTSEDFICSQSPILQDEKISFSSPILDFGVIPIGVQLERKFHICNLKKENIAWRLVEVVYDVDARPPMYIASQPSVDICRGVLTKKVFGLKYYVDAKAPKRKVSMLLLFTGERTEDIKLNDICIVTYEVINWDIRIFSKISDFPIICSLKLHFIGIKCKWSFFIKNYTPILGCFWIFPPRGDEISKLELSFHPKFGMIRPGEKIKVEVTVVPKATGIIEKIFAPVFISKHCPPITIRFLCAVEDLNVYFYIPTQKEGYDKIVWPPKVLKEVDFQQFKSTDILWAEEEHKDIRYFLGSKNEDQTTTEYFETDTKTDSYTVEHIDGTISTSGSSSSNIISLKEFLKEKWESDFITQDYVIEIKNVFLRKPQKFSLYIENVTPMTADFNVETINFGPSLNKRSKYLNALTLIYPETALKSWDEACGKRGIVVICDTGKGELKNEEVIQLNVWIYATTWGIYTEEIVVNISNIMPFNVTVIIEVNGSPVEFPLARNTIRCYPTVRFGDIPYKSDIVTQNLQFKNTSCVPINIQWLLFDTSKKSEDGKFNAVIDIVNKQFRTSDAEIKLFLTDNWYGNEDVKFMQVLPRNVELQPGEICSAAIKIDPNYFPVNFEKVNVICNLIGYIFVKQEDKNLPNLVFRRSADDLKPLHVEILASIAMPLLKLDMLGGNSKICVHAIEMYEGTGREQLIELIFKNNNLTTVFVTFHVELPFVISNIIQRDYEYRENVNNAVIKPGDIVEIKVKCLLEPKTISQMGKWLCGKEQPIRETIFKDIKMVILHRHLNIHQHGVLEQSLPVFCEIYYPRIEVSPKFLKFGYVRIGMTKKLMLHLYNSTNTDIEFEIKRSKNSFNFEIKPVAGVIPKAVGVTRSFVDIYVYFKPTIYDYFHESIAIQTKIPDCWLAMAFNGYGIQNEKFMVDNLYYQP